MFLLLVAVVVVHNADIGGNQFKLCIGELPVDVIKHIADRYPEEFQRACVDTCLLRYFPSLADRSS